MDYKLAEFRPVPDVDAFHDKLMMLDYDSRRRIVYRKFNPRPPRYLYRFRALNKLPDPKPDGPIFAAEQIDRLRAILVESVLRLSSAAELNDPFDMAAQWVIEGTTQQRLERFRTLAKEQGVPFQEREAFVHRLMTTPLSEMLPVLEASFRRQRSEFGVCCFAGDPRSVLMWSHYAAEHSGICLQFKRSRDLRLLSRAVTVDYIDEYPTVNWIEGIHNALGDTFTRKHTRWSYEDERRIFADSLAGTYAAFKPDALTGLIFGCRADASVRAVVEALLKEREARGLPAVRIYYAHQNPRRYDLDLWSRPLAVQNPPSDGVP